MHFQQIYSRNSHITKALIISGHPRSGTTLLQKLCNSHPDMTVAFEFGNFLDIGKPYRQYKNRILKRLWHARHRSVLVHNKKTLKDRILSLTFGIRYVLKIYRYHGGDIDLPAVKATLNEFFPQSLIVGDKYPRYVFLLDNLVKVDGLFRLIIYRDCRDITASTLNQTRTNWRNKQFGKKLNTADKVAKRWVHAIELMEKHAEKLHIIRYEDLVRQPGKELESLGCRLGVDSAGFPAHIIQDTSIGKYQSRLSDEEIATVLEIAGPAMEKLGYI